MTRAAWALALLSLLVACGPLAAGGGARYDYEAGRTYPVPAGEALTLEARWSLSEAGVDRQELDGRDPNWIPEGLRGDSASALTWVDLVEVDAPDGWEVDLRTARVHRERELGERGEDAVYAFDLRVRVRVTPPASAEGLTRRVRAEIAVRGGERLPFDALVEVR